MNKLLYLALFNIAAIPFVIYIQLKNPCDLLASLIGAGAKVACPYISNPFMNILYINVIFIVLIILLHGYMYANSYEPPKKSHFTHHKQ